MQGAPSRSRTVMASRFLFERSCRRAFLLARVLESVDAQKEHICIRWKLLDWSLTQMHTHLFFPVRADLELPLAVRGSSVA